MTLEDKVDAFRLLLFRRAQELGNVSQACRELGVSRSFYYALRGRFQGYGPDGLHPKRRRGRPGRRPQLDAALKAGTASHGIFPASSPTFHLGVTQEHAVGERLLLTRRNRQRSRGSSVPSSRWDRQLLEVFIAGVKASP